MSVEMDSLGVHCDACGYDWFYGGRLYFATCPRCRHLCKTNVKKAVKE